MTDSLTLCVEGKPQGKQRPRLGKGGRVYTPKATTQYERTVALCALAGRPRNWSLSGQVSIEVACYFPDARRRDCDNVLKAVMDALNGVLYHDDSQVVSATVTKEIDRERPRTVVVVRSGAAAREIAEALKEAAP